MVLTDSVCAAAVAGGQASPTRTRIWRCTRACCGCGWRTSSPLRGGSASASIVRHTIILITSSALLLIRGCILCMHRPALSVPLASGLARARGLSPGPCRRGEAAGAPTRGEQCAFYGRELARDRGGSRLQPHELPAGRGVSQHGRLRLVAACVPHACLSSDRVVWRSVQPTLPIADATLAADRPGLHEAGQWRRHPRP